jgi:hypothetical protein
MYYSYVLCIIYLILLFYLLSTQQVSITGIGLFMNQNDVFRHYSVIFFLAFTSKAEWSNLFMYAKGIFQYEFFVDSSK